MYDDKESVLKLSVHFISDAHDPLLNCKIPPLETCNKLIVHKEKAERTGT